jgi:hypothetical protein
LQAHVFQGANIFYVFIILANFLNSVVRSAAVVGSEVTGNAYAAAITTVTFYGFFGVCLMFSPIAVLLIVRKLSNAQFDCETCGLRTSSVVLSYVAALVYYYGANIIPIMDIYGDELKCGETCARNIKFSASVMLAIGLLLFFITPGIIERFKKTGYDGFTRWSHTVLDVSQVIIQLNAIYSEVSIIIDTSESCTSTNQGLSITLIVFTSFVGLIYLGFLYFYTFSTMKPPGSDDTKVQVRSFGLTFVAIVICAMVSLVLHILAQNTQPIGCAFGCDDMNLGRNINATVINSECDMLIFGIANLVFSVFSPLFFLAVFFLALGTQKCDVDKFDVE